MKEWVTGADDLLAKFGDMLDMVSRSLLACLDPCHFVWISGWRRGPTAIDLAWGPHGSDKYSRAPERGMACGSAGAQLAI